MLKKTCDKNKYMKKVRERRTAKEQEKRTREEKVISWY